LTRYEEEMASGKHGPGLEKAINILIKFGRSCSVEKFVPIASAHTMPKEPPELLMELTEGVEAVPVLTTLHPLMSAFNPDKWMAMGIREDFALSELKDHEKRQAIYKKLGFIQTYSCLPMHVGNLPRIGDYISWIGSCAQIIANSIIGARTNKDGTIVNLCSALTGRALYYGLLKDENRRASVVVRVRMDAAEMTDDDFGALGYYVGEKVWNKNVVFEGISREITFDQLKYLIAPAATSGSVHVCHVAGVTPEAPTTEAALGGQKPEEVITVDRIQIEKTKEKYRQASSDQVDLVVIGCPHVTIEEAARVAGIIRGKKISDNSRLWLAMSEPTYCLARTMGFADEIEKAGGVFSNTCLATIPDSPIPDSVRTVMTNSFKAAHYITALQKGKVKVVVGSLKQCLQSAVSGKLEVN
jgi:predicted aconitase